MSQRVLPTPEFSLESAFPYLFIGLELVLAVLAGITFSLLGADGGSWILGGIVAGALGIYGVRVLYNLPLTPNRNARKIGQLLVGLTIGFSVQQNNLSTLSTHLPILALLTLLLLCSGSLIGYLYSRVAKTDLLTALLATVPGNIGVMASMAADYDRNATLVSLVQLTRFTVVTLVIPMIANVSAPHDITSTLTTLTSSLGHSLVAADPIYLALLLLVVGLAIAAVHWGGLAKIPVAALFCPIVVGMAFNLFLHSFSVGLDTPFELPPLFNLVGQILLGITIGEYWGVNPRLERRAIAFTSIPVVLTFLAGLLSAGIAMLVTPWDWLTCLLVTSPGGSPEMILIALTLHHNVEIVTTGHLVRLIAINLSLPVLISLVRRLENRIPTAMSASSAKAITSS